MGGVPSPRPCSGLPGHPHSIWGTAVPKKESSGFREPNRFLSLAKPRALRLWKGGGACSDHDTQPFPGPSASPPKAVPRTDLPPALPSSLMASDGEVCARKQCRATAACQRPQQESGGCLSSYTVASVARASQGHLGTDLRGAGSRWKAPREGAGADRPSLCRLFQFMVFVCFVSLSCFLLLMCPHAVSLQALSPT